jgi:hypothetical protein
MTSFKCFCLFPVYIYGAAIAQSVQRLGYGWTSERLEFESRYSQDFSFLHVVPPVSGVHTASYPWGTGRTSRGKKATGA